MKTTMCNTARQAGLAAYGAPPGMVARAEDPESTSLRKQEDLWLTARTLSGARRVDMATNVGAVLPEILQAAATCEGDYCDLGETVYRLINQAFRQACK